MSDITINETTITVKEYNHIRVLTFKDIEKLHTLSHGTAYRTFKKYQKYFTPNEDYYLLKKSDITSTTHHIGFEDIATNRGTYLLTLSGYSLIAKSITDETSYPITREIISKYFNNTKSDTNMKTNDKYISVKDFAKQMGYSTDWVYRLIKRDEFKDFIKIIDGKTMLHICGLGIHKHNRRHRKPYAKPRFIDYVPASQVHTANENIGTLLSEITSSLADIANRLDRFEKEFDNNHRDDIFTTSQFEIPDPTDEPQPNRSWISKLFSKCIS